MTPVGWTWWRADRPHWQRTAVIVGAVLAVAGILTTVVVGSGSTSQLPQQGITGESGIQSQATLSRSAELSSEPTADTSGLIAATTESGALGDTLIRVSTGVAKETNSTGQYVESLNAVGGERIRFIVFYGSEEATQGRTAEDVSVEISLGAISSDTFIIGARMDGADTAGVYAQTTVTVEEGQDLEPVSGSAVWSRPDEGSTTGELIDQGLPEFTIGDQLSIGNIAPGVFHAGDLTMLFDVVPR